MKKLLLLLAAAALLVSCGPKQTHLPRNAKSGVDTEAFDKIFSDIALSGGTNELHGIVVLKDGAVIYERYDEGHGPEVKHALWSASKTFTATAVGLASDEGLLSVDDPIIKFFNADELPANPSDTLKALTIKHLLMMSSGFAHDRLGDTEALTLKDPTRFMLNDSFSFYPGTLFRYNSMNTYLLSVIVSRVTGKKLVDYLGEKLFAPMGIADYWWKESAEGYNMGGWGLFLRTEDLAKMGQLFLNKGRWNGKQLVSEAWIAEAMSVQIMQPQPANGRGNEDWLNGYGYQMWHNANGSYRLDGAWGQFSIIAPEKNAVIAVNSVCGNAQAFLRYVMKDIYDKL